MIEIVSLLHEQVAQHHNLLGDHNSSLSNQVGSSGVVHCYGYSPIM